MRLRHQRSAMAEPLATTLSWDVDVKPVFVDNKELPNYQSIVRNDNGKVLSITKKSYYPATNERFLEVVSRIHEFTGFSVEGYTVFQEGRKVLAFLRNHDKMNVGGFDSTNYMVVGNSFDRSTGFFTGISNVVTRCTNQFSQIHSQMNIRHNKQINMKLDELVRFYKQFLHQQQEMKETFESWTLNYASPQLVEKFMNHVLDVQMKNVSTKRLNQRASLLNSVNREMSAMGPSLYGLFNGLTHYITHVHSSAHKSFGNALGYGSTVNNKGYVFLKQMCNSTK